MKLQNYKKLKNRSTTNNEQFFSFTEQRVGVIVKAPDHKYAAHLK